MNSVEVTRLLAQAAAAAAASYDDLAAALRRMSYQNGQSIAAGIKLGLLVPTSRLDRKARRRRQIVNALNRVRHER